MIPKVNGTTSEPKELVLDVWELVSEMVEALKLYRELHDETHTIPTPVQELALRVKVREILRKVEGV